LFKYWGYQLFSPSVVLREKYEGFKSLLSHDKRAHELMAELEEIYYNQLRVDFSVVEKLCDELSRCVSRIVDDLFRVCPSRYSDLEESILSSFKTFSRSEDGKVKLAMRSSAAGEDSQASFAGQYLTVLNMDFPKDR